ncbi:hypothetical protein [Flavobacterium sp.]|uniref:hypothetical protein n=1 Tax=Flavobacterium sp. TaxID=239 RepID=UPI00262E8D8B|nr:hypothetical protein [Flavobacterium sp.]MDD3004358.1 hypothetical protein [Flavobacterium sp.]
MKLTNEQIDRLYQFTRQHFVEWYDLQTELVDHLANAIEQQWQEVPDRSFDEALQIEFKKFGVFGFMDVVEQRQMALGKKYNKLVWKHFKEFFRLPQIIGTISAMVILYWILKLSLYSEVIFLGLCVLLLVLFFYEVVSNIRKMKQKTKETGKKWLFKEIIGNYGQGSGFFYLPFQTIFHFRNFLEHDYLLVIASFSVIVMALLQYVIWVIIPNKAEEYLKEAYPEYEFVK